MKKIYIIAVTILISNFIIGQSPKREERASWLATVWRIDWPITVISSTGNTAQIQAQKNEMTRILDSLVSCNMNAIYFQVRSRCDAMYNSSYEPWSSDLTGSRGMNPGYDPLAFAIQEAHKRGLELHAWLNPYRYETVKDQWTGLPGDYRTPHPDWILTYSSISILDPGRPEVRKRIKNIIGEIVNNYDVDGIIFDDYFYAYGGTSSTLDAATQALYKPANMDLGDWRRDNVNKMIKDVFDTIQSTKPFVKFGVSPFGIWTTDSNVALKEGLSLPQGITGGNMYAEIYCDPVAWLKQGSVDYISPQLYWTTTSSGQDYDVLCPWWSDLSNKFNRHFYSSQTLSGLSASSYAPPMKVKAVDGEQISMNAVSGIERVGLQRLAGATTVSQEEIGNQIIRNRLSDMNNAPGSVFYSTNPLYTTAGFTNYLRKTQFTQKSLTPAISWKSHSDFGLVTGISLNGNNLTWNSAGSNLRYSIYAIPNDKINNAGNLNVSTYLLGISYTNSFVVPQSISTSTNTFAVAIFDRYGNEFPAKLMNQPDGSSLNVELSFPTDASQMMLPFNFTWNTSDVADNYLLEISEDNTFSKPILSRELTEKTFSTDKIQSLQDGKTYYWRVKARKPNAMDGISQIRSFTIHNFALNSPVNGSTGVWLTPTFEWDNVSSTANYTLEISTNAQFSSIIYSKSLVSVTSFTIPVGALVGSTSYYARVKVVDGNTSAISSPIQFVTMDVPIPVPQVTQPFNGQTLVGNSLDVCWQSQSSKGFRVELSESNAFPPRSTTVKTTDAYTFCTTFDNLTAGKVYYIRMYALTSSGMTDPAPTISVNLSTSVTLNNVDFNCYLVSDKTGNYKLILNSSDIGNAEIAVYSITGKMIWTSKEALKLGKNSFNIDLTNFNSGIYLLNIQTERNKAVLKIKK